MRFKVLLILMLLFALAGCGVLGKATPQALPTVVLGDGRATPSSSSGGSGSAASRGAGAQGAAAQSIGVTASGVVAPAQDAQLAGALAEVVKTVRVAVGDQVQAGQVLVELNDEALQVQSAQAKAALDGAQASYDLLAAGPTAEQLRQAAAALVVATANYSRTISSARPADVAAAQAALNAATDAYQKVQAGPQKDDLALAKANMLSAEAALKQAQTRYDDAYRRDPAGIGGNPAALALEQATNTFNAAKALYDKAAQGPDKAQLSAGYQQVESARAALERTMNPTHDYDIVQAKAQVEQAQAQLDALKAGPKAQQLSVAKSQIASAQAQVRAIEVQSKRTALTAPFAGTVSKVSAQRGEWVVPGQPILELADLTHLRIETTDLSERDIPRIAIGQPVKVLIKALNQEVSGRVSAISPLADTRGGDVVYKTTLELDTAPTGLRAGMSVQVQF